MQFISHVHSKRRRSVSFDYSDQPSRSRTPTPDRFRQPSSRPPSRPVGSTPPGGSPTGSASTRGVPRLHAAPFRDGGTIRAAADPLAYCVAVPEGTSWTKKRIASLHICGNGNGEVMGLRTSKARAEDAEALHVRQGIIVAHAEKCSIPCDAMVMAIRVFIHVACFGCRF